MVDLVFYVDEMTQTLQNLFKEMENKPLLYMLYGMNTDSNNYSKPAKFEVIETLDILFNLLLYNSNVCWYCTYNTTGHTNSR